MRILQDLLDKQLCKQLEFSEFATHLIVKNLTKKRVSN